MQFRLHQVPRSNIWLKLKFVSFVQLFDRSAQCLDTKTTQKQITPTSAVYYLSLSKTCRQIHQIKFLDIFTQLYKFNMHLFFYFIDFDNLSVFQIEIESYLPSKFVQGQIWRFHFSHNITLTEIYMFDYFIIYSISFIHKGSLFHLFFSPLYEGQEKCLMDHRVTKLKS